jgi:hypothetical protein
MIMNGIRLVVLLMGLAELGGASLPKSLYLTEKPAWFGSLAWPAFGPDAAFEKNRIPAQVRFESLPKK